MPVATASTPAATPANTDTGGITSLASSSTWTAGYEWVVIDNTGGYSDIRHSGKVRVGTTPTSPSEIRIYLIPCSDGTNWPDVFDGTPSAETVTSEGVRDGFAVLAAVLRIDATTSNRDYFFDFSAREVFGGCVPQKYSVFIVHNTGATLNATGAEQIHRWTPYEDLLTYA
jgi:hypothetical protein